MEHECQVCHKKFESETSLQQHMNNKHGHNVPSTNVQKKKLKINLVLILVIAAAIFIAGLFVILGRNNTSSSELGKPISSELLNNLTSVNYATLSSVGHGSASNLRHVVGAPLKSDGKPVVLYIGADYCPFCASERWAVVVALSKFGNFSGLNYMTSSSSDVYPDTHTLSFHGVTYTSPYIAFQSVETQDRAGLTLEIPSADQQKVFNSYNPQGGIPFLDINNQYVLSGSQFSPDYLSGKNWEQIGMEINDPNNNVAKGVDGTANTIITAVCKSTNQTPTDLCSQSFANLQIG